MQKFLRTLVLLSIVAVFFFGGIVTNSVFIEGKLWLKTNAVNESIAVDKKAKSESENGGLTSKLEVLPREIVILIGIVGLFLALLSFTVTSFMSAMSAKSTNTAADVAKNIATNTAKETTKLMQKEMEENMRFIGETTRDAMITEFDGKIDTLNADLIANERKLELEICQWKDDIVSKGNELSNQIYDRLLVAEKERAENGQKAFNQQLVQFENTANKKLEELHFFYGK